MPPKRNLSLEKKSSARMAAVQCLYKGAVMGRRGSPAKLVEEYLAHLAESQGDADAEWMPPTAPHVPLLHEIVEGVAGHRTEIETILNANLKETWSLERMPPLLTAVLQCAIFELLHRPQTPAPAVVDEYVHVAGAFFGDPELGFVNALLHQLSVELRENK